MSALFDKYRDRLYTALLGDIGALGAASPTNKAREALESIAALDLAAIEPIVEEMLTEAAGAKPKQFRVYLRHLEAPYGCLVQTAKAATEQDAIEAVLDGLGDPTDFVVDKVEAIIDPK